MPHTFTGITPYIPSPWSYVPHPSWLTALLENSCIEQRLKLTLQSPIQLVEWAVSSSRAQGIARPPARDHKYFPMSLDQKNPKANQVALG